MKALENGPSDAVCPTTGRVLCIDFPPLPPPPAVDADGFVVPRRPMRVDLSTFMVAAAPKKQMKKTGVRFRPLAEDDVCRIGGSCGGDCDCSLELIDFCSCYPIAYPVLRCLADFRDNGDVDANNSRGLKC